MISKGEQWRLRQCYRAIEAENSGHTSLAKQIRADLWADAHCEATETTNNTKD